VASPVIGGSHLNRMKVLDQKLKANGTESYLFTDLKKFRNQVNGSEEKFFVILDVPASHIEDLSFLINRKAKVVGYEYSGSLIVDYNIIPFLSQYREFNAKKEVYSGLKYLIIRDEIINQKNISFPIFDSNK
jgi:spore coat polysaccharide biosynthesis predicted glycosyltransferase SpsG